MAFSGFALPDIKESDLSDQKQRRQILEYLYQLTEQLRYVLSHLDEENFSDAFKEQVGQSEKLSDITQRVEDAQAGLSSVRRQTAEGFAQTVKKGEVVSAINQSAEAVQIAANKINLSGYVTMSSLETPGGTVINGDNITTGTLSGDRIYGGTIRGTVIDGAYVTGGTIMGAAINATQFNIQQANGWFTPGFPPAPAQQLIVIGIPNTYPPLSHCFEFIGGILTNYYST